MRVPAELMAAATAGLTVLTPTVELATALADAVEREHRRTGHEIWATPRIRELSSWLRELSAIRQLADSRLPRCLTEVEERELWRAVIENSESSAGFMDLAAGARAARRARRTVQEYAIPLHALSLDPSAETQLFLQWNQEFDRRCRNLDCVSVDMLLSVTPPPSAEIVSLESPAWRPAAREWLSRFGRPLLPRDLSAEPYGQPYGQPYGKPFAPSPQSFEAASPELELTAAAQWAADNLRSTEGFRAWIHVRDLVRRRAEVVDAFDAELIPGRFALREDRVAAPYAVAGGTPLADYAPVRAALRLLTANFGIVSFQQFSELLLMPDLHATLRDATGAARLELALRTRAPSEADMASWLELADETARSMDLNPVGALQRLREALTLLQTAQGVRAFSAWVPMWVAAIEAAPWNLRARWSSAEFQAAERFRELLSALAAADAVIGTQTRESAHRVLQRAARDTAFQPQTGVPAVWISGQAVDPWLNYDGLWITGCSDDRWPAPVAPVALVPIRLQREYGVTAASSELQMQLAMDLQRRWQARTSRCVFSWASAVDGIAAAPSPLLPGTTPLNALLAPSKARPHWVAMLAAAPPLERFDDELAPPFSSGEHNRGVSTLCDQSRCAFRGFARTRLRTEQMDLPLPGFNRLERGNLVHYALEHVWSELRDSSTLVALAPAARQDLLDGAARRAVARVSRRRDPGRRWREREVLRLQQLLGRWLDLEAQRPKFRVEHIETEAQSAVFGGLKFNVRIDRVDSLADGGMALIDYKTGSTSADWRGERPNNPQLPIYALLRPEALVAVAYGSVNASKIDFVAETERRGVFKTGKKPSALEGQASFAALIELWRTRVERLAGEFAAGRAEVAPTLKACGSCDLQGLCRVPAAFDAEEDADE
jgi:ATP-dependent helicase/nuclease subunit B